MRLFLIALALAVIFGPKACSSMADSEPDETAMAYEIRHAYRTAVKDTLKDPRSAEFRNEFFGRSGANTMGCGEVNAANSLGGMTGFKRFVTSGKSVFIEGEISAFKHGWAEFCAPYQ